MIKIAPPPPVADTKLTGKLFYSRKEWKILRDRGRNRTFGILPDGRIVEYTEMVSLDALAENPGDCCGFDDAEFIGIGSFHHWEDDRGVAWGMGGRL